MSVPFLPRPWGAIFAGLCLVLALPARWAWAEPEAVLGQVSLSGAQAVAAYVRGSGGAQIALVADRSGEKLRKLSLPSLKEVGTAFDLLPGCAPAALLADGDRLYVACSGLDAVDVIDLTGFSLADPSAIVRLATRPSGVAVGSAPKGLFQHQSGAVSFLVVANVTDKSASVLSLSSPNEPIGVNANDGSEVADALSAPVAVRVCGDGATPASRSTPVGLGVGTQRLYVACDDGVLSSFDPFAGGDFSVSTTVSLGLPALVAATGRAGSQHLFVQAAGGTWAAADLSGAESGGQVLLETLFNDGAANFFAIGPAAPRGLLFFADALTGNDWLALWGTGATGSELRLFDVTDLSDVAYVPPTARDADRTFTTGLAAFSGTDPLGAGFAGGNLHLPSGGTSLSIVTAGPVFTFTAGAAPLTVSSLSDPGLSSCTNDPLPLTIAWTASESIDTTTFGASLAKSTDAALPLAAPTVNATDGQVTLAAADVADLAGVSEEMTVRILATDVAGNPGVAEEPVLLDGQRPSVVSAVTGRIGGNQVFAEWAATSDPGSTLASGVTGYAVTIVRFAGTLNEKTFVQQVNTTQLSVDFDTLDPGQPLGASETLEVSVAACDGAGNRSANLSAPLVLAQVGLGATGVFGESGGCVLSESGAGGSGLASLLMAAALLLAFGLRTARFKGRRR